MRIFEIVKENVNLREAAELYGIDVNRYGKALCPFHNDRHPSLYVADDHYYCFACGEHGDVIDFVGRLFQLSPYDAARKLMADFHLSPDKPPSAAALHAKRIRTEAQQLRENERLCFSVLSDYARVLRDWKVQYAPQSPDEPVHARFVEACRSLDQTEYHLDILCAGDSHERADVIHQQMVDGKLEQVDPDDVEVGTEIVVDPGEKVPIDGVIVEGTSALNTAALTGESLPRDVQTGDEVISGCVNMTGLLKVRTTKEFGESTVSKILDLVENSSMKKARAENFITRFARVYTPAVCYGALALAFLPPIVLLLMGQPARFGDWIYRALTFLVISCPCALVISIPLSFFGGIGGASACGILVKGSTYLEELARTGIVVFDKTGTLTQGTFKVVGIHPENGVTGDALVEAAALAESWSRHPISLSIRNAYGKDIDPSRVTDVQELGGHGVTAKVDGKTVAAGNARLMAKLGLTAPEITEPGTIVHVAMEGRYAGYLLIADVVKPHSAAAIKGLKQAGVRKTVMLTGDAEPVAKAVSAELGLDEYHAGLLPGDKVDQIETLLAAKQPKENLAFVGDGINDAPVLSRADVGIAMGALGSDAAIEAADVVLMDDDPAKIALAMRIARRTLRIVYQNIVFALAIKFACLVLGALGLASMWTAIFADVGVMVLAVLNATRALYTKDLAKKNAQ